MKKLLLFVFNFCFVAAMGQNLIRPITISLPPNPKANTADWATAMPPVVIMAQTKMDSGRISPIVTESKILVTIQSGGAVICGSYNQQTAPQSNFNSSTKTWSGAAVTALLGKDCVLKPGTYELCVQFYALNPRQGGLLGEACKTFTIADTKEQSYSPPQNVMPADGRIFTEQETSQPITLRWTPVVPKPQGDVLYKVRLVEILPGQNKTEALRSNTPIDILEVKNQTQTSYKLSKRITGLYWEVEAESAERVQGEKPRSYGKSEATSFSIQEDKKNDPKPIVNCTAPSIIIPEKGMYKLTGKEPLEVKGNVLGDIEYVSLKVFKVSDDPNFLQKLNAQGRNTVSAKPIEMFDYKNASKAFAASTKSLKVQEGNANQRSGNVGKPIKTTINFGDLEQGSYYVVFQNGNCQSNPAPLSVTGNCDVNLSITNLKDSCMEFEGNLSIHKICFDVNYQSPTCALTYLNSGSGIKVWKSDYSTNYTLTSTSPALSSQPINAATTRSYCVTVLIPPTETSVVVALQGDACYTQPVLCQPGAYESVDLKFCKCNYCDNVKWELSEDSIVRPVKDKEGNWFLYLSQEINIAGQNIKSFKAEVISFKHRSVSGNEECIVCDKNSSTFGNITTGVLNATSWGSVNGVFPVIPGGGGNTHHTMNWFAANGSTTTMGGNLQMLISAPPFSTIECCDDFLEFCIRYTMTTKSCESCSIVVCYGTTRKHKN
jgi:hypothetical protein